MKRSLTRTSSTRPAAKKPPPLSFGGHSSRRLEGTNCNGREQTDRPEALDIRGKEPRRYRNLSRVKRTALPQLRERVSSIERRRLLQNNGICADLRCPRQSPGFISYGVRPKRPTQNDRLRRARNLGEEASTGGAPHGGKDRMWPFSSAKQDPVHD